MSWVASYRLQLRDGMDLRAARRLLPYLQRLGVSHLYLSPLARARRGSSHGYDVVDPRCVDPALGGERALAGLAAALGRRGLGALLDIVPNHMAADPESPVFADVLQHGPASRFAAWFDIEWRSRRGGGYAPLRLPVLGAPLAACLERGELRLRRQGTRIRLLYFERAYPLDPASLPPLLAPALAGAGPAVAGGLRSLAALPPRTPAEVGRGRRAESLLAGLDARLRASPRALRRLDRSLRDFAAGAAGRRRLARLLTRQAYRLMPWQSALRQLDYRRFFDVNELIALRAEDPTVFRATHAALLGWVARGWLQGLRVDHVDGLLDPQAYLTRLRRAVARLPGRADLAILVEKILAASETLPRRWPVDGTTGYEFVDALGAVRLDPVGAGAIEAGWRRWARTAQSFEEAARDAKRCVLRGSLRADVARLARRLGERAPDLRPAERRAAIVEVIAALPVYRTYAGARGPAPHDRARLRAALAEARAGGRASPRALEALARALQEPARGERPSLLQRFQQLSGPAAAKGVEDTAFYRHVPLLSRNEVGGDPGRPLQDAVARLHAANAERARRWPRGLLAASTHDTKRSADARARLDVLSEIPERWLAAVERWRVWNAPLRGGTRRHPLPDANTEYLLYQSLVGVWPLPEPGRLRPRRTQLARLGQRIEGFMLKAAREAKLHTGWLDPDARFEAALTRFVRGCLEPSRSPFVRDLARFVAGIARPGLWNALAGSLIQLTAPGVPDLYQGDELWSFALVDPDNRRPVDFARRRRALARVERGFGRVAPARERFLRSLVDAPEDGCLKLHVIRRALQARARAPALFTGGAYTPLRATGCRHTHVVAYLRRHGERVAVVVAPRLPLTLWGEVGAPARDADVWDDTFLSLPRALAGRSLRSALTGERLAPAPGPDGRVGLSVTSLFRILPVALLEGRWTGRPARRRRGLPRPS